MLYKEPFPRNEWAPPAPYQEVPLNSQKPSIDQSVSSAALQFHTQQRHSRPKYITPMTLKRLVTQIVDQTKTNKNNNYEPII